MHSVDVLAANESGLLLFNRWESADVEVKDISLTDYIQVRNAISLPHTAGRYAAKQFRKAQMPIVERLVNRLVSSRGNCQVFPWSRGQSREQHNSWEFEAWRYCACGGIIAVLSQGELLPVQTTGADSELNLSPPRNVTA